MIVNALMIINAVASLVALWYGLCAINAMSRDTRHSVRWAFVAKASGYFTQVAATVDFFHGEALAWPWLLLVGVILANAGTAALYLVNRRRCGCEHCPRFQEPSHV